jgi:hypothetical protein
MNSVVIEGNTLPAMMTPPEHYQEAEKLLAEISSTSSSRVTTLAGKTYVLALAQVHATLACAKWPS